MARSKNKTNNSLLKPFRWFAALSVKYKIVSVACIIAVGLIGYNLYLDYQDRQKFNRIEETVLELTNRINQEFDTETVETRNYCRHDGVKLGTGQLGCVASSVINLDIKKQEEVYKFISGQTDLVDVGPSSSEFFSLSGFSSYVSCRFFEESVIYPPLSSSYSSEGTVIDLNCIDEARSSYYPINE